MRWHKRGSKLICDDIILTIPEFRDMVKDDTTELDTLIDYVNSQNRIEFLPKQFRSIAYSIAERRNTHGSIQDTGLIWDANDVCYNSMDYEESDKDDTGCRRAESSNTEPDES